MPSRASRTSSRGVRGLVGLVALVLLAGCTASAVVSDGVTVTVSNDGCSVSPASADSGTVQFTVVNASDEVAAFDLRADKSSLGGIGNIAPGISRAVLVELAAGSYLAACTAGPTAEEITAVFTVTDSGAVVVTPATADGVAEAYAAWVRGTTADLRDATDRLAVAFASADPGAQQLYREARALWASLRPALTRFPELLPAIDARESDLVVGERLGGWHAIEKDLWPPADYLPLDAEGRGDVSAALQTDLADLLDRVDSAAVMDAEAIAAGAQALMDAASRSLSDGDERWSHAERWLVQGDLDGATAAIDALRPALAKDLLAVLDDRSASLQEALDDDATQRELASRVDSLATALSLIAVETARIEP